MDSNLYSVTCKCGTWAKLHSLAVLRFFFFFFVHPSRDNYTYSDLPVRRVYSTVLTYDKHLIKASLCLESPYFLI